MVHLRWLSVVVMACVCVPSFGSVYQDNSTCSDLTSKAKILDCIHLCRSMVQNALPELSASAMSVKDENDLLLRILLALLVAENKLSESDLKAHANNRRSYSMEHFRWGKPSGGKRRPVKVFATSLEGGGSSEGSFTLKSRRQRSSTEEKAKVDLNRESNHNQGLPRARVSSKSHVSQERKDGTYRMSHFRWGSPIVSKRKDNFMKKWDRKPLRRLTKLYRNIIL